MLKQIMSEKNPYENEDLLWKTHMRTLMRKKRNIEISRILDEVFYNYYTVERGLPVPEWRSPEPQWWIEYLRSLDIDDRNNPLQ